MRMKPSSQTRARKFLVTTSDQHQTTFRVSRRICSFGALIIGGLAVLFFFNPMEYAFYPTCPFYKLTHLHCPGCGSLRAVHQLTHGHISAAFHSNPLLIGSLPVLAWFGVRGWRRQANQNANAFYIPPAVAWTTLAVVIAFGVLRNLPFPAFSWMSP